MADCMNFPKTIIEFLHNDSFKDEKEVYTNGSELIQVFDYGPEWIYNDFVKRNLY